MRIKKNEAIDLDNIKPEEKLKYEIASELGYLDKVMSSGWKSLTAKESGRIGGLMTKRKKEEQNKINLQTNSLVMNKASVETDQQ